MRKKIIYVVLLQLFFVAAQSQNITRFEYFIDTDPGAGNATAFVPTAADSVTMTIPFSVNNLSIGHHVVGIRSLDADGKWSHTEFAHLYVETQDTLNRQMIRAEFFIGDADPGIGAGRNIIINTPADSVTMIADTILNNLALGDHKISVRFRDNRGLWSHLESRQFTVCSTYGAQSEMSYQVEGNTIFFTNKSLYTTNYLWKFGDNTSSGFLNPIKTYSAAGNYNLQLITDNSCGADTLTELVTIRGLQRISPLRTGDGGVTTVTFNGFGFSASTPVKLVKGLTVVEPIQKFFESSERIAAYFNMTGLAAGSYDAVAVLGSGFDTLRNALVVENSGPVVLSVSMVGGRRARPFNTSRYANIYNHSNQDAIMVPYASAIGMAPQLPYTVQYESYVDLLFLENKGIFQNTYQYLTANGIPTSVMSANDIDSSRKQELIAYYKIRIPAASYTTDYLKIKNNISITYSHAARLQPPLFSSNIVADSIESEFKVCMNSFLKKAVRENLSVTINDAAWNTCFNNAFDTLAKTIRDVAKDLQFQQQAIPVKAIYSALLSQIAQCGTTGMPASLNANSFNQIIKDVTYNWLFFEDLDSLGSPCFDTTMSLTVSKVNNGSAGLNQISTARTNDDDCPGAAFAPELAEQCEIFTKPCDQLGQLGEIDTWLERLNLDKVFEKFTAPFDKFCKVNSASVFCEKLCEMTSLDPNDKTGPGDNNLQKYVNHLRDAAYTIRFENLATAAAPAAYVEIRDTIDKTSFNTQTIQTGILGWGDSLVSIGANRSSVSILRDLRPTHPNKLRIDVNVDTASGIIVWKFWTLDTVNLQLTTDPTQGFLPPNTDGKKGIGFVTFSIKPKDGVSSGTILNNKATIIFDQNAPIITPEWEYRIDTLKPQSQVNSLPPTTSTLDFNVSWAGADAHSGINKYSVYVSIDDSLYKVWRSFTSAVSDVFHGQEGHTYKFFSIALDNAGNFEEPPGDPFDQPDAQTTIAGALPLQLISFTGRKIPDEQKTELTWKTSDEINVSYFEIQKSMDGTTFVLLTSLPATNSAGIHSYSYVDNFAVTGRNFYRLKIVDRDGQFKYSNVVLVRFDKKAAFEVYPTLVQDQLYIQVNEPASLQLIDMMGRILKKFKAEGNTSISLKDLPSGVYVINDVNSRHRIKIVKY